VTLAATRVMLRLLADQTSGAGIAARPASAYSFFQVVFTPPRFPRVTTTHCNQLQQKMLFAIKPHNKIVAMG
jgi:hypothetical protein